MILNFGRYNNINGDHLSKLYKKNYILTNILNND